jgi:DNA-binding GntR family transcriptional regulator
VRFRGLRGQPSSCEFGFEAVFIPETLGRALDISNLGNAKLFSRLEEVHGIKIVAVAAPSAVARARRSSPRAPLLKARRIYQSDDHVVEVAVSYYDVTQFHYVIKLFPE